MNPKGYQFLKMIEKLKTMMKTTQCYPYAYRPRLGIDIS